MSVLINFAMFPMDDGLSLSEPVSKVIDLIRTSGFQYRLNPMGTTIETNTMEEALGVVNKAYLLLEKDHERIYSTITVDARKGEIGRMKSKIESVEQKIGRVNS